MSPAWRSASVAPSATSVRLVTFDIDGTLVHGPSAMAREGADWVTAVAEGTIYGLVADGDGPRFDPSKVLVDPWALEVWFPPGHDRELAKRHGVSNAGRGPLGVARHPWPARPSRRSRRPPVVYEAHVRGLTRLAGGSQPGTYAALLDQLPRSTELGVTVVELLPIHQNDPAEGSYWGYMPVNFAAVHRQYAATAGAADELAAFVAAAHGNDIEVWLDVVFNHTTEVDALGPTYHLRGLSDAEFYRLREDGSYIETTGCGNDVDADSPPAQDLIMWSLDRLADLGIDGFRFDLAAVLSRSHTLVERLDRWAASRGVAMISEPWDAVGNYQLGRAWPGDGWMQWNDRFRDDVRSFLRAEPVAAVLCQRVQGSPDLFDAPMQSVNFVSCHDGFTLYDVVAYDHKHNEANRWAGMDGTGDNRSWNCGWEGDEGVPEEIMALRRRQLRNAWCLLALAHGVPMASMGDELGRTQGGNNNAYNQDNETSWVDWDRAARFADLEHFVTQLLALRARHPVLSQATWWHDTFRSWQLGDRTLAWQVADLSVIANSWWEPVDAPIEVGGEWRRVVDTSRPPPEDIVSLDDAPSVGSTYHVAPRTVVVFERP